MHRNNQQASVTVRLENSVVFLPVEVGVEIYIEDDNASTGSADSLAILPDLRSYTRDLKGRDLRADRARSALRRNRAAASADKIPFGVSRIDLSFQYSNKDSSHRKSGETLDSSCLKRQ